ncbi:MAG TPA: peptidylprolyl isomerase [Sphingomicrobium sp.]|nr:peptidylprolyl isomerase [Sphingomicrobium sp.]
MVATELLRAKLRPAIAMLMLGLATAAIAQTASDQGSASPNSAASLHLPNNPQVYGTPLPSIVKATAIVNGVPITQTDIDQRLALLAISNNTEIPANQLEQLRQQMLRNLIDETLEIQAAKADKITVSDKEIDRAVQKLAAGGHQTPEQFATFLQSHGSSINSIRRQIEGELAWNKLQQKEIEDTVTVGEDEVNSVIAKLNAEKGAQQYRVSEIYIASPGGNENQAASTASQILDQLKKGASFQAAAHEFSEASTAAVGGDLGWVRPDQLPQPIATVLQTMQPGEVSNPIPVAGGVSIIAVQDVRRPGMPDPRDAVLSLKQVSITFPKGTTKEQAEPLVAKFAEAAQNVGGCGGAEKIATQFNGEVVQSDQVKLRDLPPALQQIMLPMQVGQATRPFGSVEDGVRILVMCGRDQENPVTPTYDEVYNQLNEQRVNARAEHYLRDLRRDAVIEYR